MSEWNLAMSLTMLIMLTLITYTMLNISISSMMLFLVMMVTSSMVFIKMNLGDSWSSILLFLALVGGLMILFSFFMSTLTKENNPPLKFYFWPTLLIAFCSVTVNYTAHSKQLITNLFIINPMIPMMIMVLLIFILLLISKIIIMPNKPFKSVG